MPAEKLESPRIILRLGAIDEDGWVWLNGEPIGEVIFDIAEDPDSWKNPLDLDVTDKLKPGTNTVAVRVRDQSGMGGLWKPCYLIYGDDRPNLLKDGSFEAQAEGWGFGGKGEVSHEIIDTDGYLSDHCVQVRVPEDPDAHWSMTTVVPATAGARYAFSLRYKTQDVGENPKVKSSPAIRFTFRDEDGKSVTDTGGYVWSSFKVPDTTTSWREATTYVKAVEGTVNIAITMFFHRPGTWWLDDVSCTEL